MVLNTNYGIIVGTSGKIYKSTNNGINWSEKLSGTAINLNSICKTPSNLLFAVGDSGAILISTNYGENLVINHINTARKLNSVYFIDDNKGFIVGDSGKTFMTTNAGSSWIPKLLFEYQNFNNIKFFDNNIGYIIGDGGVCRKTTDGGQSWGWQSLGLYQYCNTYKIFLTSPLNAFLVGADEYIFRTTDGGGQIYAYVKKESETLPKLFFLSQNYPNPFNPSTRINFDISKTSSVKLIVYDILGREVAILVNEKLKPGSYEYEWDGSEFASGVYFYRLITDEFTETRKMVLLR
jgi:photosystem II stability/assembly factor-like uncharacterized protein